MQINKKTLFNPDGDDSIESRSIIGGETTNILNLNNVKYHWATEFYREGTGNFWLPEKHDLTTDKLHYPELSKADMTAYDQTLSFLTFLDSLQVANLPNVFSYITSPEVACLGALQQFQEMIHAQSYSYLFEAVLPANKKQSVYYFWKDNPYLLKRNKHIAQIYQNFQDDPSFLNFYKVLIANLILEGIYFYNGFTFFYNLQYRNLMMNTASLIRAINLDENLHKRMFAAIIKTIHQEIDIDFDHISLINEMVDSSVKEEIAWSNHIFGDNILGISSKTISEYTQSLGDGVLEIIHLPKIYNSENPYLYLVDKFGENQNSIRGNFFESNISAYSNAAVLSDWDKI